MTPPDTYIIYGSNSEIGAFLAKKIAPCVKTLILFHHSEKRPLVPFPSQINILSYQHDIRDYDSLMKITDEIAQKCTITDLATVYLPAIRSYDHKPLSETSLDITKEIIDVNLLGSIHFLKAMISLAKQTRSTKIVMLGSNVSRTGLKNGSVYAATKAAIANLTKSVSKEVGRNNILINTISPGPVETNTTNFDKEYKAFRDRYFKDQKDLTSLNKLASPEEVCDLIKFLTSLENTHITGEELFITGGSL
jgi:3-oxoacyl-[acyl-carrier protein] reductase